MSLKQIIRTPKPHEYLVISIAGFVVSLIWVIRWINGGVFWWEVVCWLLGSISFFVSFLRAKKIKLNNGGAGKKIS
jgi:hypothetical protein